jgi:hypothetical protein
MENIKKMVGFYPTHNANPLRPLSQLGLFCLMTAISSGCATLDNQKKIVQQVIANEAQLDGAGLGAGDIPDNLTIMVKKKMGHIRKKKHSLVNEYLAEVAALQQVNKLKTRSCEISNITVETLQAAVMDTITADPGNSTAIQKNIRSYNQQIKAMNEANRIQVEYQNKKLTLDRDATLMTLREQCIRDTARQSFEIAKMKIDQQARVRKAGGGVKAAFPRACRKVL